MAANLQRETDKIKQAIISLGDMVENQLQRAMQAIKKKDVPLARQVIDADALIDEREIEIEEECLKVLALYQPVASDLRFLVAVIKINNDLERIADYAANIARRFQTSSGESGRFRYDYAPMTDAASNMLKTSLRALVEWDVRLVRDVLEMDRDVNRMRNEAYDAMKADIREHPEKVSRIINMYLISRHLERVGDHAKNIAEEVNYLIEGEIIRHT